MTDTAPLMSIGQFSSRSRLSVRMLRHYDARGVLVPAQVDASGYRRYRQEQLADAAAVRQLRDVGLPVSAIAALLAVRGTAAYVQALLLHRDVLTHELGAAEERLALLQRLLHQEGPVMENISVIRDTMPVRTIVGLRGTVPTYGDEGMLWSRFMPEVAAQGLTPRGPGGCIEHDAEYRDQDVDETVWLPVAPGTRAAAPLAVLDLPVVEVVMARIEGPYSLITEAHRRIEEFVRAEGLAVADRGPDAPVHHKVFNIYLNDPGTVAPEELRTHVCVPLA